MSGWLVAVMVCHCIVSGWLEAVMVCHCIVSGWLEAVMVCHCIDLCDTVWFAVISRFLPPHAFPNLSK